MRLKLTIQQVEALRPYFDRVKAAAAMGSPGMLVGHLGYSDQSGYGINVGFLDHDQAKLIAEGRALGDPRSGGRSKDRVACPCWPAAGHPQGSMRRHRRRSVKLKVGDAVWATCVRVQTGVLEELPGTIAATSTCVDCGDSIYFIRVPDLPCPMRIRGAPPGCWMSSEKYLRPRGPGSAPAPAGAIAAGLWRPHGARLH